MPVQRASISVGDILELKDGDIIPADCVLLHSDRKDDEAFMLTTQLDGERCLKPLVAIKQVS